MKGRQTVMATRVPYRLDTSFSPTECVSLLRHAFENQATVRMAPNWSHAPHVVSGTIGGDRMKIHYAGNVEDAAEIPLCAEIVPTDAGSAIVGEFRLGTFQLFSLQLMRLFITLILLGLPAFIAYWVWKDESAGFTPSLTAFTVLPVVVWLLLLYPLRRWISISEDDTRVVREFIERAMHVQNIDEADVLKRSSMTALNSVDISTAS